MADYYGTVGNADTYHSSRGNTAWASVSGVPVKETHLLNASEFIDSFANRFPGSKTGGRAQVRAWPRKDVVLQGEDVPDSEVPNEVIMATYEAALLFAKGIDPRPNADRGGAIKRKKVAGGPAEVEIEYMDSAPTGMTFKKIEDLLSGVFEEVTSNSGAQVSLLRF